MAKKLTDWHYPRPKLAQKYLDLFRLGLVSSRCLFARRRMGKTEFLQKDFLPAAKRDGYTPVYVNLWGLKSDPSTAIISEFNKAIAPKKFQKTKIKLAGKIADIISLETELEKTSDKSDTALMEAMQLFDQTKLQLILIIDEAQVLAYAENSDFAHALRAALDIRKDRIKVIFAGSSESTLRRMFGVPSEPFYNWAPLEPFELLGNEFVVSMVNRVNAICKYPLKLEDALLAFNQLKKTPEFFRRYIEHYLMNPEKGSTALLKETKQTLLSDVSFEKQWESLLSADQVVLFMRAKGVVDLYGKNELEKMAEMLGVEDGINKNTVQNALRRLSEKNILTRIDYGVYQFEDEAFEDWIKHRE